MSQLNSKKPIPGKLTRLTRRPAKQLTGYAVINSLKVNILPLVRSAFLPQNISKYFLFSNMLFVFIHFLDTPILL